MRAQCAGILLQFLLDYPLGAKRLGHHLQFLVANLGYEHEAGRGAALGMIQARAQYPACVLLGLLGQTSLTSWSALLACMPLAISCH